MTRSYVCNGTTSEKTSAQPLETWDKTRSSLMWPWLERMVISWRLTRWFLLLRVPFLWTSWRGTNIPIPWSIWGMWGLTTWWPWWNSSIMERQKYTKKILTVFLVLWSRARFCKVCEKEGGMINIMDHIEAKHIAGISIPCGLCEQVFRTRVALRHHKPKYHRNQ